MEKTTRVLTIRMGTEVDLANHLNKINKVYSVFATQVFKDGSDWVAFVYTKEDLKNDKQKTD